MEEIGQFWRGWLIGQRRQTSFQMSLSRVEAAAVPFRQRDPALQPSHRGGFAAPGVLRHRFTPDGDGRRPFLDLLPGLAQPFE